MWVCLSGTSSDFHVDSGPSLRLMNSHASISQTIPILPRSLRGPGQACIHQLIQWLESQSTFISKEVTQIPGIHESPSQFLPKLFHDFQRSSRGAWLWEKCCSSGVNHKWSRCFHRDWMRPAHKIPTFSQLWKCSLWTAKDTNNLLIQWQDPSP